MRPIEIHIEGYKIVISKEDDASDLIRQQLKDKTKSQENEGTITPSQPYKVYPTCPNDPRPYGWWEKPFATWTSEDSLSNIKATTDFHIVRDAMVGKTEKME